jgi:hypothetical protein
MTLFYSFPKVFGGKGILDGNPGQENGKQANPGQKAKGQRHAFEDFHDFSSIS